MPLAPVVLARLLRGAVCVLIAVLALGFNAPAQAQEGGGAPVAQGTETPGLAQTPGLEALSPLLDVLRDEAAREALIAELESRVSGSDSTQAPAAEAAPEPEPEMSLGGRIAMLTQGVAETAAAQASELWRSLRDAGSVFDGLQGDELSVLFEAFQTLLLVIVLTVVVFVALRALALPFFRAMGKRAGAAGVLRTSWLFAVTLVVDVLIVISAWAIGYLVTVLALGEFGQIGFRQSLYLNAFLMVELVKVAVRAIVSPSAGGLRVLPLGNIAARRLNRTVNFVVTILGYGQLLIVPIVNQSVSFPAGLGVSAALSVMTLLYLIVQVVRYRQRVSDWLEARIVPPPLDGEDTPPAKLSGVLGALVHNWHWITLAYLAFMFITVMSRPTDVVYAYLGASAKILAAVLLASLVTATLSAAISRGVRLPEDIRQKLPLLEPRLNAFVPKILIGLRYFVALVVGLYVLDTTGIIRLRGWLDSDFGLGLTGNLVSVGILLLVAYGVWLAMTSWVDYRLNADYGSVPTARETTLLTLLRNAATIAIFILTLMFGLSEIGLDIGPLLASAGVLGLAIGFGAQKMVQDIITGVFIQFENAINVGDVITVGGITGAVEKLTVRSVSLRDLHGVFHIIPFSSVDMVSNFTRDFAYFVCDMGVAYRENVEEVRQAMLDGFEELRADAEQAKLITGDLEWFGLNSFGDSAVVLRARIKTLPGMQWGVGRAYNAILKRIFDARGIEIPFPHQTIFFGETKDGRTQPIRLADQAASAQGAASDDDHAPRAKRPKAGRDRHDDDPDVSGDAETT